MPPQDLAPSASIIATLHETLYSNLSSNLNRMAHKATFPSPTNGSPDWRSEVQAALKEANSSRLLERVHAAETAIFLRLQELADVPESMARQVERREIAKALDTLMVLKREKLGFPDWETK
jgi:hypothetical protein